MTLANEVSLEELATFEEYAVIRCVNCTCVNVAWVGSARYEEIMRLKSLRHNYPLCTNHSCKCHGIGGQLQGKLFHVGKEAPF